MSSFPNTKNPTPSNNHSTGGIFFNFSIGTVGQVASNFLYISRSSAIDPSLPTFSSLLFYNFPTFIFHSDTNLLPQRFSHFFNYFEISLLLDSFLDRFAINKSALFAHFISPNLHSIFSRQFNIADLIFSHHSFLDSLSPLKSIFKPSLKSSFFPASDMQHDMQHAGQFNHINHISNRKISNNFGNNFDHINQNLANNKNHDCQKVDHSCSNLNHNLDQYCQNFNHNNNDLNHNSSCNVCNIEHQFDQKSKLSNHGFSLKSDNIIRHKSKQISQKSNLINSKSSSVSNQTNTKTGANLEQSNLKSEINLDNLEQILTPKSTHFDQQYLFNLLSLSPSKLKKFLIDNLPNSKSLRSHYRIKISFEDKIDTNLALTLAKEYMVKHFPDARFVAACHQNTDNTHIHVLLLATDIHGKKLHFSNSIYKKLDLGWAKIYAKQFGLDKLHQHLDKKQQTLDWKKDKMLGIDREQPQRVKHPSKSQPTFIQQPLHNKQLPLNQPTSQQLNLLDISKTLSNSHSLLSSQQNKQPQLQHNPQLNPSSEQNNQPQLQHDPQLNPSTVQHQNQPNKPSIQHQSLHIQLSTSTPSPSLPPNPSPKPNPQPHQLNQSVALDKQLASIVLKLQQMRQQQEHLSLQHPPQQLNQHQLQSLQPQQPQHQPQQQQHDYTYDHRENDFGLEHYHDSDDDFDYHDRDDDFDYER